MLAAGMAFAFTACQKEEGLMGGSGDLQQITVNVPTVAASRASIADYGDGGEVNRCILQVYREGEPYGGRMVTAVSGNKATFSLQLVSSQEYDFVFWADCGGENLADNHYVTTDLANITVKEYSGNNDEFDAFFYTFTETVSGAFSKEVTLKRPFGQLNITTTDIAAIETNDLKPAKVKVSFNSIPTSFNALTGELGETVGKVEYTADVIDATTGELTVDYIWAAETEANLSDFTVAFINASGTEFTKNENFKNIPIRRNYQTNVSGNLLTKAGDFNVTINPGFDGGYFNNT